MADDAFWSELDQRLQALSTVSRHEPVGATAEEIASLEAYAGRPLPGVYRDFLLRMGRSAGKLFVGSDYSIAGRPRIRYREYAERLLLERNSSYVLPNDAFVFYFHQGYVFLFIPLDQGDDPPVFIVSERAPYAKHFAETFTFCLMKFVSGLEHLARRFPNVLDGFPETPD